MHTVIGTLTGAVVVLVLWAGSAQTTCGFVLWEHRLGGRNEPQWQAKSAFATLDECRKDIEETIAHITANTTEEVSRSRESGEVTLFVPLPPKEGVIPLQVYRFRCLPDTVKPQL